MTDNEIIKGLECCSFKHKGQPCEGCPAYDIAHMCMEDLMGQALDLINQQKAQIERLTAKILTKDNINDYNTAQLRIAREELRTAKSEAIKEFAERLKKLKIKPEFPWDDYCVSEGNIDNLVKEITK